MIEEGWECVTDPSDYEFVESGNLEWPELIREVFSTKSEFAVSAVTECIQLTSICNCIVILLLLSLVVLCVLYYHYYHYY